MVYILYIFNYIPHKQYRNEDFNIKTYTSNVDKDGDGIDDQTDILNNVREYIATNPKYKSQYYANGYPDDEYGVCTDVVAFGLKNAGYDLMQLVNEDIQNNRDDYEIETIDKINKKLSQTQEELKNKSTDWGNYIDARFDITKGKYSEDLGKEFNDVN